MPKPAPKKSKTSKTPAAGAKKGSKKFLILFLLVGAVLLGELLSYALKKANEAKEVTVQKTQEFTGDATKAGGFKAWDMALYAGNLALSDQAKKRLLILDRQGSLVAEIGGKSAGATEFNEPSCLTSDASGNLYVMDTWNGLIRGFDAKQKPFFRLDLSGKGFYGPRGLAWDDNTFLIADTGSHRVVKLSTDGSISGAWGTRGSGKGQYNNPYQVVTDGKGQCFVVDRDNDRIQVLDKQGHFVREIGLGVPPTAEAVDLEKQRLYVSSQEGRFVKAYSLEGKYIGSLVEAGQKGQSIPDINALCVLPGGDLALLQGGTRILIYRIVPTPPATN